ncbi:MAG: DUF5711 family protein [Oscillospiraceae bacterium]|nr:DUF5711 family protein [Oscillospiraceae bacterium]
MSGDDKPKGKSRKILGLIFWLVILALLTLVALSLIPGKAPGQSILSEIFAPRAPSVSVSEFNFDVGRERVFANAGGHVAAVGSLGLQMLSPDGQEVYRHAFRASAPAITENNGFFIAYDIGGTSAFVFNTAGILSSIDTDGIIVSASVNKNGWFCIVTQARGMHRGTVSVYNSNGDLVYLVNIGVGFTLAAELSPDNKNLAILSMAEIGSRITFYNGIDAHKDDPDNVYNFTNEIVIDIDFISSLNLLAISTQALHLVDFSNDASAKLLKDFDGKRLAGYTHNDRYIAVHLYDYSIGYSGSTVTLDFNAEVLGETEFSLEIISMVFSRNTLMILRSDGLMFFNHTLEEYPAPVIDILATAAGRVLAISDDMALVANDHSAVVIRRGEDN